MPMQKSTAARSRNWLRYTSRLSVSPGDGHGAHERGEQEHGYHLEGDHVGAEKRVTQVGGTRQERRVFRELELRVTPRLHEHDPEHPEKEQRDDRAERLLVVVEAGVASDRRARQHDPEEEEHDDGSDVDDDLHGEEELGREQDVLAG